ncbi:MAG: NUDIX hydrolase [Patescibacteria group bacterium]|nr:NUDIX hydrolase [Patescibacteria group bacterium]
MFTSLLSKMVKIDKDKACFFCHRYLNRDVTIDGVILKGDKVLLIKRKVDPYINYWALPGGHVSFDETVEEAVKREVTEETGLECTKLSFIGVYSDPHRHPQQSVALAYSVKVAGGKAIAGSDALSLKYFDINLLPDKLAFDHKKIISDFLRKSSTYI